MRSRTTIALPIVLALLALSGGLLVADDKAASDSPIIGDWQGREGGMVAQVYAVEGGKYQANLLKRFDAPGNLVAVLSGVLSGEQITFEGDGWSGSLQREHFKGQKGEVRFDLQRVLRLSPTLNAKPPPGATVLFDGSNLDQWAKPKPKQWDQADGPADNWKLLEGGAVEVVPGSGSIITKRQFGDFRLHAEFRTLGSVNSGVYLHTRYEIGLKDSYGQTAGSPCAAPGNFSGPRTLDDLPNAAAPPLQWQTLDIEFRAPRFAPNTQQKQEDAQATVALNGVKLYENFEITAVKGAAKRLGEAAAAPLMLQEHGSPIQFRNIWIVEQSR